MATYKPLSEFTSDQILPIEELISSSINEVHPDLDLTPGSVLRDVVVNLYAALEARIRDSQDTAFKAGSLLEIEKNPEIADDLQVDRVLSNFNVSRSEGTKASGIVRIAVSSDTTTMVSSGTVFIFNDLAFKATSSVRAVETGGNPGGEASNSSDTSLVAGVGGTYIFDVHVEAAEPGVLYNIVEGTKADTINPKISRMISATAIQTFLGGRDAETNTELIQKLKDGIVGKILGGRAHTEAKLKSVFPYVRGAGITGFGDPELTRDIVSIEDGTTYHRGGTVDIHVKSANYPLLETLKFTSEEVTSTSIMTTSGSIQAFQLTLPREFARGLYAVRAIRPDDTSDPRSLGPSCIAEYDRYPSLPQGRAFKPAVETGLDLGFSSYQELRVIFVDTGNVTDPNTVDYSVDVMRMPFIDTIQEFVSEGEDRSVAADTMVKGVVPILLGCNLRIVTPPGSPDLDLDDIKIKISNAVNSIRFGRPIPTSLISYVVHKEIAGDAYLDLPISLYGKIYFPDKPKFDDIDNTGTYYGDADYDNGYPDVSLVRSSDKLEAPNMPERGVSDKTVGFFLSPYTINISVVED